MFHPDLPNWVLYPAMLRGHSGSCALLVFRDSTVLGSNLDWLHAGQAPSLHLSLWPDSAFKMFSFYLPGLLFPHFVWSFLYQNCINGAAVNGKRQMC